MKHLKRIILFCISCFMMFTCICTNVNAETVHTIELGKTYEFETGNRRLQIYLEPGDYRFLIYGFEDVDGQVFEFSSDSLISTTEDRWIRNTNIVNYQIFTFRIPESGRFLRPGNYNFDLCDIKGEPTIKAVLFNESSDTEVDGEEIEHDYILVHREESTFTTEGEQLWVCTKCGKTGRDILPKSCHFEDVYEYDWYYEWVKEVYTLGLMTGASDTLFKPSVKMNRGMAAIVICRMIDPDILDRMSYDSRLFPDVKEGEYWAEAVTFAKYNGLINGYGDGTFKPAKEVTREEMVQILYNLAKHEEVDVTAKADLSKFKDGNKVSSWHTDAMKWAVANGIISGKYNGTKLDPQGTTSRAECAKMLVQAYKVIYK